MKALAALFCSLALLGQTPVTGIAKVEGADLFYEKAGQGPAVVLIHDGLLHHVVYDDLFPHLARERTVLRYDRRGYGRSTASGVVHEPVADLAAVMTQAGVEKAWLVGMSAGGMLAVDFALAHPDRVQGLVLLGAVVSGLPYTDHFLSRGGRFDPARIPFASKAFVNYFAVEDPYQVAPGNTAVKERTRRLLEAHPQNMADHGPQRLPQAALGRLGSIRVPTTILVGEHDIPDVHAVSGALNAGIPGSRRKVIRGSGHLLPLEQPQVVNLEVSRALAEGDFFRELPVKGATAALADLRRARAADPGAPPPDEARLNTLAYERLQGGRVDEALDLFRLNVELYPDSWNAHDSLGEAWAVKGDRAKAETHYRRSLDLNPRNRGAQAALEALRAPAAPAPPPPDPRTVFAYDAAAPLDVKVVGTRELEGGVTVQDVQYASPVAGRVTAFRVAPSPGTARPAGLLFMHWGQGDRSEFLAEAVAWARAGAVCLLLDAPWGRPAPWRQGGEDPSQPERTRAMYVQTVVDLRRGVDLLVAGGADPARIGFVGHSFGATWGGPLAGVEPRIRAAVLMGGLPDPSDLRPAGVPKLDAYVARLKSQVSPPVLETFARAIRPICGASLVGAAAPGTVFFQFGTADSFIARSAAEAYAAAAREPKVAWYECSHEFNEPAATRDRTEWLARKLGLKAGPGR